MRYTFKSARTAHLLFTHPPATELTASVNLRVTRVRS